MLIILVACTLAGANGQVGPSPGDRETGKEAHAFLSKMKESRELLRRGTYRASGRILTTRQSLAAERLQGSVRVFSAFDLEKGLIRFDRTQPVFLPSGGEQISDQASSKFIRTPEFVVSWVNPWENRSQGKGPPVGIRHPATKPTRGYVPFDVRSLGLCLWDDFKAVASFEDCYEIWDKSDSIEVSPEANGVYRLLLKHGGRSGTLVPQTLWLDEHRGFSPIRLSHSVSAGEPGQPEPFISDCRVQWKKEAGAWVPTAMRLERRVKGRLNDFCALSFEWISVNKPVARSCLHSKASMCRLVRRFSTIGRSNVRISGKRVKSAK